MTEYDSSYPPAQLVTGKLLADCPGTTYGDLIAGTIVYAYQYSTNYNHNGGVCVVSLSPQVNPSIRIPATSVCWLADMS